MTDYKKNEYHDVRHTLRKETRLWSNLRDERPHT